MQAVNTLADFIAASGNFPPAEGWFYRGQSKNSENERWALRPMAGRDEYTGGFARLVDLNKPLEGYDLEWFFKWRTQAVAYSVRDLPTKDFECLAYAQHYGLATRLLDWSKNPLAPLYFAVSHHHKTDGAVYFHAPLISLTAN